MVKNNSINAALPIAGSKGGTGVNNGVRTITLGGNITTGNTLTTTGTFNTGGNFNTGNTFNTTGTFSTGGNFSTGNTLSTTGTFATGGNFATANTFSTGGTFATTGNFSTGGAVSTGGTLTTANAFTTSGNFGLTLTTTALTNITLPTTGTLATLAGVETFTNKSINGTVSGTFNGNTEAWFLHNTVATNVGQTTMYFQRNSVIVGTILTTLTNTSYNTTSDGRLKSNRTPIENAGELIDQLEPVHYTWNHVPGDIHGTGFIAQDVYNVIPECIVKGDDNPDLRPTDPDFKQWGADWTGLVPYLVAEIKSLRARIDELEKKNAE